VRYFFSGKREALDAYNDTMDFSLNDTKN